MGVDNLMNFVKNATSSTHVQEAGLPNSTAAVDISHWIYKACYACPEALWYRTSMHEAYNTITNYIDNYVKMLKFHNVELTFVFDGLKIPAKRVTHEERALKKAESREMVEKLLAQDNKFEARKHMVRCIDVTWDMIQQVIRYCKREQIKYIVAPYEADAQIAFLNNSDLCQFVITEDTDLILYGCKKIIYKLDTNGHCMLYERSKLSKCLGPHGDRVGFEKFRRMCILSGCDYLKNIPNVGLQSAKKFFSMTIQDNIRILLPKLATYLKSKRLAGKVTEEYIQGFIDAETTFRHHIVYDPLKERLVPLEPYPKGRSASDFPLAGRKFPRVQAQDMAEGRIDLDEINPEKDLDSDSDASENDEDEKGAGDDLENQQETLKLVNPTKLN